MLWQPWTWWLNSPDERSLGIADEAKQHQKADEDIEQKQAYVAQPPVKTNVISEQMARSCAAWNFLMRKMEFSVF